jgi:hypothetical protein
MRALLLAVDRFWYRPAPAARLALLRILVGVFALGLLCMRFTSFSSVADFRASEFHGVGPVALLPGPLPPALVTVSLAAAIAAGLGFVTGYRYRVTGPLFALLLLWVTSYRCSWGMKFHTENLLTLHVLLLGFAPAADALAVDARRRGDLGEGEVSGRYGWVIRAMCAVTVVTYVLAGVAKLKLAGFGWAGGDVLRAQVAYDNLRKIELGSLHSPLGVFMAGSRWPFSVLAALTLVLELGAPLALLGARAGRVWALAAWSFHLGVLALMLIAFGYPLSFVAYASFFEAERLLESRPYRWFAARLRLNAGLS